MSTKPSQLYIFLLPYMATGHMIPTMDLARLFATRGCKTAVILTPANAESFAESMERNRNLGLEIEILVVGFPAAEVGLPQGFEHAKLIKTEEVMGKFITAVDMLENPVEQLLEKHRPDYLVADPHFTWATQVAAKFDVPRLVFHTTSVFTSCVLASLMKHGASGKVPSGPEPFVIPDLPHQLEFTRDQLPFHMKDQAVTNALLTKLFETSLSCHGAIFNSFYGLEAAYVDHYRRCHGTKAWHIGPLSLVNSEQEDKALRGPKSSIGKHECLDWLDSKEPNSVVYVSFGSEVNFDDAQLMDIATALEASGQHFIWAVRKPGGAGEEWLPRGFEERIEGKGLVIRGWAPQVMILEHEATAGFVTHCGWNSVLEGVCAGLPMVTWPLGADQFLNEKVLTTLLGIGVSVGATQSARYGADRVSSEAIQRAVRRIMEGEEAEEMRKKSGELGKMTREAFAEGGSSHKELTSLIEEFKMLKMA